MYTWQGWLKRIVMLILVALLPHGFSTVPSKRADARTCPDILGSWQSGEYEAHKLQTADDPSGSYVLLSGLSMTLEVTMQHGASSCSFHGVNTWSNGAMGGSEDGVGVFHEDGKTFTILELEGHPEGGTTAIVTGSYDGATIHWHYAGTSSNGDAGTVFDTDLAQAPGSAQG